MNELVKRVSEKTGLPEDKARQAVEAVMDYLKDKLPAPIAGQLESVLEQSGDGLDVEDITKGLGGLLGK